MSLNGSRLQSGIRSLLLSVAVILAQCAASSADIHTITPVFRGPSAENVVALTFDDGPDPRFTPRILEILKEKRVDATFFVVGQNAEKYPELIRQEILDGNTLGNHTFSHPEMTQITSAQARIEIEKCDQVLENITKSHTRLFRPPKGFYSTGTLQLLSEMGYEPVLWSLAVEHSDAPTPSAMVARVLGKVQPGIIILAHDGRLDRGNTVHALPGIIDGIRAKGYRFVSLQHIVDMAVKADDIKRSIARASARSHASNGQPVTLQKREHGSSLFTIFHLHIPDPFHSKS